VKAMDDGFLAGNTHDTRQFSQKRILKGLRASQFASADSKGVAVTEFSSRDEKTEVNEVMT